MKSLRTLLLASAPVLAMAVPALAADVNDTRSTPINTSTANNGAADNVTIGSSGRIEMSDGAGQTAVTLDSNNTITNAGGTIIITNSNNSTGIRVLGGFTGSLNNAGAITIDESSTRTDTDGDGTLDGPFAQGGGRTGILIEGPATFTGDIAHRGSIAVEGNASRGIDLQTNLAGNIFQNGSINVVGDNNIGFHLQGDVSGDVVMNGGVNALGQNSSAAVIGGDVAGGVTIGGAFNATGFQYSGTSNYFDPDEVPEGFEPPPFDGDDLKNGGPAVAISGDLAQGLLVNGQIGGATADDPATGTDPTKDIKADFDVNRGTGIILSNGSAPALIISPNYASAASTGDIVIGLVVEHVRDSTDDDNDGNRDEIIATFLEQHGFINRGTITADGLNMGFDAQAVVIRGAADGSRNTIIDGGIYNDGSVSSTAKEADATTFTMGAYTSTPGLDNDGVMRATVSTEDNHTVTVLLIEANSFFGALNNTGSIEAVARGDGANVIAIQDLSGTLVSINNTRSIAAAYALDNDDDDGDGTINDLDERTGERIAIDLSANTVGATIRQTAPAPTADLDGDGDIDADDIVDPQIIGDVRLGSGADDVQLMAGTLAGDLAFGAGADELTVDGGGVFIGELSDIDGQLVVAVNNGELNLAPTTDVTVTTLNLGTNSTSSYAIDLRPGQEQNARIVADTISIAAGSEINPRFVGLGSTQAAPIEILRAENGLTLAGGQSITDNLAIETPFLFETGIATQTNGAADSVVVTVRRRTPDELGMSGNQAAAYEPAVAALNADEELLIQVVNLSDAEEFYTAYNQLMPEFSLASMQFAVSNMDGAIGAVGNRLDVVRGGRDGAGAAWMQEFGLFLDRETSAVSPGYRGNGFGMAAGIDRPFGPFYAIGVNVVGAASEIEETTGFDTPLSVSSGQVGAYAAANAGNLLLDLYAGAGADFFESERRIVVGDVARVASGEWKAHHATATARLAYDINVSRLFARPAVSVDYFRMYEESYTEAVGAGSSIALRLDERSAEMLATTASLTVGAQFGNPSQTWWSPRLRVGYRYESLGEPLLTEAQFLAGGDPFTLTAEDLPATGGLVGFTFAAGSRWSSFALDYDADVREGFVRHGLRVAFRFIF